MRGPERFQRGHIIGVEPGGRPAGSRGRRHNAIPADLMRYRTWSPALLRSPLWLLTPVGLLYGALGLVPAGVIVWFSLAGGGAQYSAVLHSRLLLRAAANTLWISLITTAVALALGTLLAAALWRSAAGTRAVLFGFVLLPFWTAVLIKNFAWAALLQDNGAINAILQYVGLTSEPLTLLHNRLAVIIGMVHFVLPYAVFPIFNAMQAIDDRIERAARSLGASAGSVIWHVVVPLILPGLYSAALLVFVVSLGFFITPVILGAPSDMMIANLVDYYVHELVNFSGAAALAVIVLVAVMPLVLLQQSLRREGQHDEA
jgi:putative spermidine/putrescine transport system permease protein